MFDVESMKLGQGQIDLIRTVGEASKRNGNKTIVLINAGTPVEMPSWVDHADSIMQIWFGGQEGPKALASVINGSYSQLVNCHLRFRKSLKIIQPIQKMGVVSQVLIIVVTLRKIWILDIVIMIVLVTNQKLCIHLVLDYLIVNFK